jgi:hypothetical protein
MHPPGSREFGSAFWFVTDVSRSVQGYSPNLHGLTCDRGIHVILSRPAVRAYLPRLVDDLLELLFRKALDLDVHLHSESHVEILHATNEVYLGLNDGVLGGCRHLDVDGGCDGIHGGLEARSCLVLGMLNENSRLMRRTVASSKQLLRVGLACVALAAEHLSHGQVDL